MDDVRLRRAVPAAPRAQRRGARISCSPGVALGIAAGTKWYGVSSVAVVVAIWIGARVVTARRARGRDGAGATRDVP